MSSFCIEILPDKSLTFDCTTTTSGDAAVAARPFASTIRIRSPKTFRCCSCFRLITFCSLYATKIFFSFFLYFVNSKTATADRHGESEWERARRGQGKALAMCNICFSAELLIFRVCLAQKIDSRLHKRRERNVIAVDCFFIAHLTVS